MKPDFAAQLDRQIGFLERSCVAYDSGHQEEALRIAVTLRVLFHDTPRSVSLLTHLGIKSSVRVLSTFAPGYKPDPKRSILVCYTPMWLNCSTGERTPPLENADGHEFVSVEDWWSEVISSWDIELTRKDIVLCAANQDGGAHVDATPDNKTKELVMGVGILRIVSNGNVTTHLLDNHHFPVLRQFAYEVLTSPGINRRRSRQPP